MGRARCEWYKSIDVRRWQREKLRCSRRELLPWCSVAGLRRAKETGTKSGKSIGRPTIDPPDSLSRGVSYRVLRPRLAVLLLGLCSGLQRSLALSAAS
jgi:hypothetical protein